MEKYPHGCDADREHELIEEAKHLAHLDGDCKPPCDYCEAKAEAEDKETGDKENEQE